MNIRYVSMLVASVIVTKSYCMELDMKSDPLFDPQTYETPAARAISLGKRCWEHAASGFVGGLIVGTSFEDKANLVVASAVGSSVLWCAHQTIRGFNDSGFKSGPTLALNQKRQLLTFGSEVAGFAAGVGTATILAYLSQNYKCERDEK